MDRTELEDQLREVSDSCPRDGGCARCDVRTNTMMSLIDTYLAAGGHPEPDLWTADEIAAYAGLANRDSARAWASKNGVTRVDERPRLGSGRPEALYRASQVRAVMVRMGKEPAQ